MCVVHVYDLSLAIGGDGLVQTENKILIQPPEGSRKTCTEFFRPVVAYSPGGLRGMDASRNYRICYGRQGMPGVKFLPLFKVIGSHLIYAEILNISL